MLIFIILYFFLDVRRNSDQQTTTQPIKLNQTADADNNTNLNNNQTLMNPEIINETAEGLKIERLVAGSGPAAKDGDIISVHYTGTFIDGQKFDSSLDRGAPFSFTLGAGQVIKGWDQGVAGMQVGEQRQLTIPYQLGYGADGYGPIPAKATLIFTVELLSIN